MKKLSVEMPSAALVDAYLSEIAKGYNIKWSPPKVHDDHDGDGSDGGVKVRRQSSHQRMPVLIICFPTRKRIKIQTSKFPSR